MSDVKRIRSLGLEVYLKPGTTKHWLLPVCAAELRDRLAKLRPANPGNWELADIDGCPTMCYRMTLKHADAIGAAKFRSAWGQLKMGLGEGPASEFFPALRLKYNNVKAQARNKWERLHGGLREQRFNKGPSIRAVAHLSIT